MKAFELSYEDLGRICTRLMAVADGKHTVFDIIRTLKPNGMTAEDWSESPLARTLAYHLLRFAANHTDSMPHLLSLETGLSEIVDREGELFRVTLERQSDGQWHICEYDGSGHWAPFVNPTPERNDAYVNYACALDNWLTCIRPNVMTE